MNIEKRSARYGAAILIFALLLRLTGGILSPRAMAESFSKLEELGNLFEPQRGPGGISMGTGGTTPSTAVPTIPTTFVPPETTIVPTIPTTVPAIPTTPTEPPQLPRPITFVAADMDYVKFRYASDCNYRAELQPLLLQPLQWQLALGEPTVLIIHSHGTESFTKEPGQDYRETTEYRTTDPAYNMIAVGEALANALRAQGISVIHDLQQHDAASYSGAYASSRKSVEAYLEAYPSIQLVLDLHRDAALNADGTQVATSATVNGVRSAQIMLLAGTDSSYGYHPGWQENLALALKLQVLLEKANPGITRKTLLRGSVFNQDLCSGMLIVEVGTAGNTLQEALRAMPPLADAIVALQYGAQ